MEFIVRNIDPNILYTTLLLVSVIALVVAKYFFLHQFSDLLNITQAHKYTTLYIKSNKKAIAFNPLFYLFFAINCSIFISTAVKNLTLNIPFINIIVGINVYILGLYFVKKICFEVLEIQPIMSKILFQKITLNHYMGLLFFIFNLITLYINQNSFAFYTYISILFMAICYVLALVYVVFQNLKWVLKHWFYFILYLCTFKISPILIGVYLISR